MNIIVVYDYGYVNGGAAQVAISSAIALENAGHHVVYFCAVGPIDERIESNCSEVVCTRQFCINTDPNFIRKSIQGIWNRKARQELKLLLCKYSPHDTIVHFHGWFKALSPSILDIPNKLGFASCITLHDFFVYCPNGGLYNYQQNKICSVKPMSMKCMACNCDRDSYFNKLWRYSRNFVQDIVLRKLNNNAFLAISDLSDREYRRCYRFKGCNLVRVNNPVTFPEKIENQIHADSYLFMGRLSNEKGITLFCEAISKLGLKGIVLGDGILKGKLSRQYPNIEFAGWISNEKKNAYLQRTKAFVFPSVWYETFGLSVAEMLALGIPCIVGDKTAAAELIENRKNGLLFKTGNVESLKEAIIEMENAYNDYINFSFPTEKYTMKVHVENLTNLYNKQLSRI